MMNRAILLILLAEAAVSACGGEQAAPESAPADVESIASPSPTREELTAARDMLIKAVVEPDANPDADLAAALLRLRSSSSAEDRIFAGSHLYAIGFLSENPRVAKFAQAYEPDGNRVTEFDAWAYLVKGHSAVADPSKARPLLVKAAALWTWDEDSHHNLPRLLLRQLDLAPGTRVPIETFHTASGDVGISEGRVVLFFSIVGCGPCKRGYAECMSTLKGDKAKDVKVLLVMAGENPEAALAGFDFPHRLVRVEDTSPDLTTEFDIFYHPYYYTLDDGVVAYQGNDIGEALRAAIK